MTTHKIDPGMVREVLGINERYLDDANFKINIDDEKVCIESDWDLEDYIPGYIDEYHREIDIHRFKDLAIAWCAGKGWYISRIYKADGQWEIVITNNGKPVQDYNEWPVAVDSILSAELAMIDFCWEQIQEKKQ